MKKFQKFSKIFFCSESLKNHFYAYLRSKKRTEDVFKVKNEKNYEKLKIFEKIGFD